jgi:hypothetical protein
MAAGRARPLRKLRCGDRHTEQAHGKRRDQLGVGETGDRTGRQETGENLIDGAAAERQHRRHHGRAPDDRRGAAARDPASDGARPAHELNGDVAPGAVVLVSRDVEQSPSTVAFFALKSLSREMTSTFSIATVSVHNRPGARASCRRRTGERPSAARDCRPLCTAPRILGASSCS